MDGSAGYGSANNAKHSYMEDAFMNFEFATAARYAAFTELPTINGNLSIQLRQQEYQIQAFQSGLCSIKVAATTQNVEGGTNKTKPPYEQDMSKKTQWPIDPMEMKYNNKNNCLLQKYDTSD